MIGIAVLSGNCDFIVRALDIISSFEKNTPKDSQIVKDAFNLCKPHLAHYFG